MHRLHLELCRRALEYLTASEDAFNKGLYNVTGLLAQISAELAVKATISFLGYTFPETHEIRKLLSLLYDLTKDESVAEFVKRRRGDLVLLEDARQRGQYFSDLDIALIVRNLDIKRVSELLVKIHLALPEEVSEIVDINLIDERDESEFLKFAGKYVIVS